MISVAVLAAVVKRRLFLLVFVVLYTRRRIFLFKKTVIQSFEVCLQIIRVVTKKPGPSRFFELGLMSFDKMSLGTHHITIKDGVFCLFVSNW